MEFVHRCPFCGWSRAAHTAVVLPPACPHCGCAVDSMGARAGAEHGGDEPPPGAVRSRPLRVAVVIFALAFVCASAHVGYAAAGAFGGIVALGGAGFLLLPFVPDRVGRAGPS